MSTVNQHIDGNGNILSGSGDVQSNRFASHGGPQHIAQGTNPIGCQINNYNSQPPAQPIIPRHHPPLDDCFLGRDKECDWLLDKLHPGKVVAVCGPGGMGKSALAAQAVSRLEPSRFPDGLVFHSFYGHPKTETALQAICEAFQVEAKAGLETAVRQVLAGKKALLFLDGAEQADDLKAVLALRGTCGVLITSRKKTDAPGARLDLEPLEKQPAEEVFREYSKVAGDDESVAGICKILGGWPVALRIAGHYVSSTKESAATYLKWLAKEPFKELAGGKHQEENAALLLRRSMDAVTADARLALGVAGTLAFASIAREPVAAILDGDERRARTALGELVNYGLLETREERWQISHALIHTYARTELPLSKESLEQLAGYYITFCRTQSKAGLPGYARLDGERAHCLRLMESCLASGLWKEVKDMEEAVYFYLNRQGYWREQLAAFDMRLTVARQTGDRKDEGLFLNSLGRTYNWHGEHEKALACCNQSLTIRREIGDRRGESRNLNNIARIYVVQGKHKLALEHYEQSLSIAREIGDRQGEGWTVNHVGQFYYHQGNYEQALQYLEQALSLMREVSDKIGEGQTLNNIAAIYDAQGNPTEAIKYYEQALAICQQLGDRAGEAQSRWNIGLTYKDLGDLTKAEEYIARAVQIEEEIGHPDLENDRKGLARVRAERQG